MLPASQPASQPDPPAGSPVSGRLRLLHPLRAVHMYICTDARRPETRQANSLRITQSQPPQASHMHT
eukprot:4143807-Prymnesium_polylepis.1